MQRASSGLRSLAEPMVDITSDFVELVLAMLGVAAKLERCRIIERTGADGRCQGQGAQFGRKTKLTAYRQPEPRKQLDGGETQHSTASLAATTSSGDDFAAPRDTMGVEHRKSVPSKGAVGGHCE